MLYKFLGGIPLTVECFSVVKVALIEGEKSGEDDVSTKLGINFS